MDDAKLYVILKIFHSKILLDMWQFSNALTFNAHLVSGVE